MAKQVEEVKMKKHVAKAKTPNYSLYNNLNQSVSKDTQTVSNKKLIKPIMHSIGLTHRDSNPVANNSKNEKQFNKVLNKMGVSKLGYQLANLQGLAANISKHTVL